MKFLHKKGSDILFSCYTSIMSELNEKYTYKKSKQMALIQHILDQDLRVFRRCDLENNLPDELRKISYKAMSSLLGKLQINGWIKSIKKGLYEIVHTATPIHEYEIASRLVEPAVVSHRSAFYYHGLTDQVLRQIYVTTLNSKFVPQKAKDKSSHKTAVVIRGVQYNFILLNKNRFFGHTIAWVGDGSFKVTDLERTLLDGLSQPEHCGGLQEVIYAFQENFEKAELDKIIEYGMRLDTSVSRRLGWVLDNILQIDFDKIGCLARKEQGGYRLLDANRESQGEYDSKWGIRQNHHY